MGQRRHVAARGGSSERLFARKFRFGCSVFEKDEYECISAAKSEYNIEETGRENRCLLLKAENVCFILGKRAFSFLQKGRGR